MAGRRRVPPPHQPPTLRRNPSPPPAPPLAPPPRAPAPPTPHPTRPRPGSPKPPAAAAALVIQVACPEARRGPPAAEPAPSPGRRLGGQPGGRAAGERGTPGRGALRLLIPLKVADQRRWYRGRGGAGGGGDLAGASAFPLLCELGLPGGGPQAASSRGGGSGCGLRTAGLRESCPGAPTGPSRNLPLWRLKRGVCPSHSQGTKLQHAGH